MDEGSIRGSSDEGSIGDRGVEEGGRWQWLQVCSQLPQCHD